MKERIEERVAQNIARVINLVNIYETHLAGNGSGRRGHATTDVLRSAVVLLHATVEDLLRSLAYWKLPSASAEILSRIPLVSGGSATKFSLGDLASHRGKSINEIISASVNGYLERSNYNSTDEVSTFLASIGIDSSKVNSWFPALNEIMKRRHQIVHRADRAETGGSGNHVVKSIGLGTVRGWINAAEGFCNAVLGEVHA